MLLIYGLILYVLFKLECINLSKLKTYYNYMDKLRKQIGTKVKNIRLAHKLTQKSFFAAE